jgi:hypothetical protein
MYVLLEALVLGSFIFSGHNEISMILFKLVSYLKNIYNLNVIQSFLRPCIWDLFI